ncbi:MULTISPECIES: MarR family winged helix-turn-helix transcriptional regulator [Rhizobium]|uniref:MarR family transcriptional regulator n=1 Tax=Rhizobium tropici TaxID=398 RepID=A0A6P1CCM4_RHITR|nr:MULTISPECIES: MarR family transcriptional regulator [Rhizobium]AGB72220.1 transcriptional regulator, MarR family [Rhizobium tropici CIAT 899]MBB4244143.1 DNA-binding MarR family transcriptional regulator [Rhizobium tropici]MBB5595246.1 DNA-binding MarR family transcriptional regulator [Rhizobium tropici]MBB6494484.1 DNA-binding MarR family transcriptional regulator [Rhizobium tropici]NEV13902.1 MarR family transcriptional regulator [Rhizobium tropici]
MEERFSGTVLRRNRDENAKRPTMGEIGLNHFAPYLMNRLMARWNANLLEELREYDMTTAKMRTLAVLSVSSSLTINELSVFAVTEQSTMSRTLDSLEQQGYIRRQPRAEDMRIRDVSITEEGRAAFEKVWPTMYDLFLQMFDGVDEAEYRTFISTLHKVLQNIRKHEI